tara:strand:- start:692 stop:2917 length:2226 start_codon:yes stop_codon:yes gene_type:complete
MGKWTRRGFITAGIVGGAALVVGVAIRPGNQNSKLGPYVTGDGESLINAWVKIDADNVVTAIVPHSEMGQGAQTALTQMLADELDADWDSVTFLEAPAEDGYANYPMAKGYVLGDMKIPDILMGSVDGIFQQVSNAMHLQITGGSASIRATGVYGMRVAGAAARSMLLDTASERLQVPVSALKTEKSHVVNSQDGARISYADLAVEAGQRSAPTSPKLKTPDEFNIMGKSVPRRDIPSKVDGTAMFGIDAEFEGMLYATIAAAPVFGSQVASFDASKAESMPGVTSVVDLGNAIAVVANGYWIAKKALAQVKIVWSETENDDKTSESLFAQFSRDIDAAELKHDVELGDAGATIANASRVIEREYRVPYLAHACMEPMNATAHVQQGTASILIGTQDPLRCKHAVAEALKIEPTNVNVTNHYMGGGFGRRSLTDVAIQAARLSQAVSAPVKLIWSREEDIQHDFYRPAVLSKFRAGFDENNQLVGWENRYVDKHEPVEAPHIPYQINHQLIGSVDSPTHVPFGAWRSVDHSQHGFFTESFIDELAHEAKQDPYLFRRNLLKGNDRLLKVLDLAAEKSNWGQALGKGRGRGIALLQSFGSIVAEVVEVRVEAGQVTVEKVIVVVDAGFAVSPDGLTAQMESGIIYGLTAAMYGEVEIAEGRVTQANFDSYPMVRMKDAPLIETHIINSLEAWGGAGEPGTPGIAPALTAAIFSATGTRVRKLPISQYDLDLSIEETEHMTPS